jgi:hypothetical protein
MNFITQNEYKPFVSPVFVRQNFDTATALNNAAQILLTGKEVLMSSRILFSKDISTLILRF